MSESMEDRIRTAVSEALVAEGAPEPSFAVEWPGDITYGDFATNAAMAAAKALGKNPRELAETLASSIRESLGEIAASVDVAGPGFINITLTQKAVADARARAVAEPGEWGKGTANQDKRIILEFSCPNPFKEMHIGHMMSTIIGESLARITEFSGAHVCRDTYGGDVGPHVAKALWGLRDSGITEPSTAQEIGKAYAHGSRAYEESEEAKSEINILNQAVYKGEDRELMELWRKGKDVSVEAFRDLYRLLDTHFDYYFFESETSAIGMDIVRTHTGDVFEESEGAVIYRGEKKGLHTLVFITSGGTPTYETKDIGLAILKEERWPSDSSIIITAAEQIGHFKVFLAALEEVSPHLANKTFHVPHGFLRLSTGKMASREGNVVTVEALISDVIMHTLKRNEDPVVAEQVAMGAIKYSILRASAGSDIIFDFDTSLSLEGDSGPYLQYALVRAKSVIEKAIAEAANGEEGSAANETHDAPEQPYLLERLIMRFPEIVARAEREHAPHHIAQYLTQLASQWNSFYANERIVGGEFEAYKLELARAFVTTMENGLWLLGIPTPERM